LKLGEGPIVIWDEQKRKVVMTPETVPIVKTWFRCEVNYKEGDVLSSKPISKVDQAIEWLLKFLKTGPKFAHEVKKEAHALGFSWRTVEQAKKLADIRSTPKPWSGDGPGSNSEWSLP
jgi:hypothetical protein